MEEYIRNAFKSLEDLKVVIEPVCRKMDEDIEVDAEPNEDMTVRDLFEQNASYILTHEFEDGGLGYVLFLEGINDGNSCDIEFDEFDVGNIEGFLAEVLDEDHNFIGQIEPSEDVKLTLDMKVSDIIDLASKVISGDAAEGESDAQPEAGEDEHDANDREFVSVGAEVETESLKESTVLNLQDAEDVDKAEEILNKEDDDTIEQIVDASAESTEDLKKSYIGSLILQCPTCKSMMYKDPDELVKVEGEEELYNIDEECPHCGAKDGFEIVGQVASLDVDPNATPTPPMDDSEEGEKHEDENPAEPMPEMDHDVPEDGSDMVELDVQEESINESSGKFTLEFISGTDGDDANTFDILVDGGTFDTVEAAKESAKDKMSSDKKLKGFTIKDESENVVFSSDASENKDGQLKEEIDYKHFTCCSICGSHECSYNDPETGEPLCSDCFAARNDEIEQNKKDAEVDESKQSGTVTLNSFDEGMFDGLVERYLKQTYSNVSGYRTTGAGIDDSSNRIVMEGVVSFKSGKEKATKFVFEAKEITRKNKLKLVGVNETFAKSKAFTLLGSVEGDNLLSESLSYHYSIGDKKVRGKSESKR